MTTIPLDQLTYRNLVAFYYVASRGSLREAAKCLEQPHREIAMMIRQLEDQHCTKLVIFNDSSAAITPEGQRLLEAIDPCLLGLAAALDVATKGSVLPDGSIVWKHANEA
ncbi:LysR family transcriptional regulator [Stenotrophomonas nitritireducens]|uniref:LysR family transcriptional regulator n=1 Tax=Stenotrophomonas nitritireducens TaxID=83617 RepID=UPI0012E3E6C9